MEPKPDNEFQQQAAGEQPGTIVQFIYFARHNKKWWLVPIMVLLLILSGLILLGGSGLAPFIYTLF